MEMKEVVYEKKDGTEGKKYVFEAGDVVTSKYDSPRETKLGKYMNYSLGVEEEQEYIQLTAGQYNKLQKVGELTGKKIEAYEYENDFGKQVGVRVKE